MKFSEFRKGGKKLVLTAAVLITVVAGALVVTAATTEPGSSSDPVVTKSYVDSAIADALADAGTGSGSSSSYEVVHVEAGKNVIATGATEMILRSGSAKAISNGSDGISDMTSGIDLQMNYTIHANHLLLVPRDDGRGIRTQTECYLMIRGPYEIQ